MLIFLYFRKSLTSPCVIADSWFFWGTAAKLGAALIFRLPQCAAGYSQPSTFAPTFCPWLPKDLRRAGDGSDGGDVPATLIVLTGERRWSTEKRDARRV